MSNFQNKKWSDHGSKAEKWERGLLSSLRKHIYLKRLLFWRLNLNCRGPHYSKGKLSALTVTQLDTPPNSWQKCQSCIQINVDLVFQND